MTEPQWWQRMVNGARRSVGIFMHDVGHGLLEVSHNMLALLGLLVVAAALFILGRADLQDDIEQQAWNWLQERHAPHANDLIALSLPDDPETITLARSLASDPASLSRQQAAVTSWLARRYHVAQEPLARLVQESWHVGQRAGLEPTLILAIMAIESSFNPFAQSAVGAQGLMQVMTRVHNDKYEPFGGKLAAFDPVTNLRVGVLVLKECIARAGSLDAGLRYYVGAANLEDDGGYASKVLAEQSHLIRVAAGQSVPLNASNLVAATSAPSPAASLAPEPISTPASGPLPAAAEPPPATPEAANREQVAMVR